MWRVSSQKEVADALMTLFVLNMAYGIDREFGTWNRHTHTVTFMCSVCM